MENQFVYSFLGHIDLLLGKKAGEKKTDNISLQLHRQGSNECKRCKLRNLRPFKFNAKQAQLTGFLLRISRLTTLCVFMCWPGVEGNFVFHEN
jgi:hypothetical protein